jgi:hypothetical protein
LIILTSNYYFTCEKFLHPKTTRVVDKIKKIFYTQSEVLINGKKKN